MSDWFRDTFDEDYVKLYAHRDEQEAELAVSLIERTVELAPEERVLDAPCGSGRHARAFARRGCSVVGLDLSRPLLDLAARKRDRIRYVQGDIRQLPFRPEVFDLVTNLFSSFGYFQEDSENAAVLAELARVCRRGGRLVFDYFNADHVRANLVARSERHTGEGWLVREMRSISGTPPRVEKHMTVEMPDGRRREMIESVRMFSPAEIEVLMSASGLVVRHRFGNYQGALFGPQSPRLLLIAERL